MAKDIPLPTPERFGLATFADLLPTRDPLIGEDPGSFAGFRDGMMRSLLPFTPYECVIAENLIAIEWELLQHRRMRDAGLRKIIHKRVRDAVIKRERKRCDDALDADWDAFVAAGEDESKWQPPFSFDEGAAQVLADDLAARVISLDRDVQAGAQAELRDLDLDALDLMSGAYVAGSSPSARHDDKMQELERRRREVKRDYDGLQKTRPLDGEIIDA